MAVSATALLSLNTTLFEQGLHLLQRKFCYYYETARSMFEETLPEQQPFIARLFDGYDKRVEAAIQALCGVYQERLEKSIENVRAARTSKAYQIALAETALQKNSVLNEVVEIHKTNLDVLVKELRPGLVNCDHIEDIFYRAKLILNHRFAKT